MDLVQQVGLRQELHLTPELRQGIHILQMSALDLSEHVQQCVEENPFLDDGDWDWPQHPFAPDEYARTVSADALVGEESTWRDGAGEDYVSADGVPRRSDVQRALYQDGALGRESCSYESFVERYCADDETLVAHLKQQLVVTDLPPEVRATGEYLIESLDANGYLRTPVEAVAQMLHAQKATVEEALRVVQGFEPAGVGARSLAECLAIQLRAKDLLSPLAKRVLEDHLAAFERKSPAQIAQDVGVAHEEIDAVLDAIRKCNPYPGAQFGRASDPIWPEVVVEEASAGDECAAGEPGCYVVRLQDIFIPHLQINEQYRTLAQQKDCGGAETYLKEKLKEAEALIANIDFRRATLYKVACCIVEMQTPFLDEGFDRMRPLTMEQVARLTDLSESTISRIANGNYMQTPRGVFELRFFFQAVAASEGGREVSQISVKHRIAQIVKEEDPRHPLSDQPIAEILAKEGAGVSRRTVNKYRADLGIPPQAFRKRA